MYQSTAVKYGREKEQEAAGDHVKETGNKCLSLYGCEFVINPSVPDLECSPDRKVYDPKEKNARITGNKVPTCEFIY